MIQEIPNYFLVFHRNDIKSIKHTVLIHSRYAGTTGLLGTYPTKETIQQQCHLTSWSKTGELYTSFALGPLLDPVDSYIKIYECFINERIVPLNKNGLEFTFDPQKAPKVGDIVTLHVHPQRFKELSPIILLGGPLKQST